MTVTTDPRKTGVNVWMSLLAASAVATSHTGDTNETTKITTAIPGGVMGTAGGFWARVYLSFTGSANSKTFKFKFGGSQFNALSVTGSAGTVGYAFDLIVRNRGSAASQYAINGTAGIGSTAAAPATLTIDTTTSQNFTFTVQLGNSGETITIESYEVWLLPA